MRRKKVRVAFCNRIFDSISTLKIEAAYNTVRIIKSGCKLIARKRLASTKKYFEPPQEQNNVFTEITLRDFKLPCTAITENNALYQSNTDRTNSTKQLSDTCHTNNPQ